LTDAVLLNRQARQRTDFIRHHGAMSRSRHLQFDQPSWQKFHQQETNLRNAGRFGLIFAKTFGFMKFVGRTFRKGL
jgi:hypothetical protein